MSVALLTLTLWLGATAPKSGSNGGAPTRTASDAQTYKQLELFARVLSYVENNYVEAPNRQQLIYGAIKGMLDTLDPHTAFMQPELFREMKVDTSGEFGGLGLEVSMKSGLMVVVTPMDDSPAARAGIRAGDTLTAIDGESTEDMDLAVAQQKMRGPVGKKVTLTVMRKGFSTPREIPVIRDHIRMASVEGALFGEVGHVRIKSFQERTDYDLRRELDRLRGLNGGKPLQGLVLDLRNNPGGLLDQAVAVSDRFLPGELGIVSTRGRGGALMMEEKSHDRDTEPGYPMAVLVNGGSASASEIVAGALQDNGRATLFGQTTFGKGSVQTVIELEDGSGLKLTVARYYTPKGRSIQERGIVPDYVVSEGEAPVHGGREKDLKRHFQGEAGVPAAGSNLPPLPATTWKVAEGVTDLPLKAALNYVHHRALRPAAVKAAPAGPGAGN